MLLHVDLFGHLILLRTVAVHVVYRHVCPCVQSVLKRAITTAMTLICSSVKLEALAIVAMHLL